MSFKFVASAMNGGKTTLLLQNVYSYCSRGFSVVLIKPGEDKRNKDVTSRIGVSAPVNIVLGEDDDVVEKITDYLKNDPGKNHALIAFDEAQFLTVKQVEDLFIFSTQHETPIICYGLKTDFRGHAFPASVRLLELAEIEELKTIRCRCGSLAKFNCRFDKETGVLINEGPEVFIEGSDENVIYDSLCAKCFVREGGFVSKA